MNVDINKLKINPIHFELYPTNEIDTLVESIEQQGLLEPIVIKSDYTIVSGVRRYLAAKKLGHTQIQATFINVAKDEDAMKVISFNKQRVKTATEIVTEIEYYEKAWGQKRGRKSKEELANNPNSGKSVTTREKIAKATNTSSGTISMLKYIKANKKEAFSEIDKGRATISQVYNALKKTEDEKKSITEQEALTPQTITKDFYTIYNKSSDDLSDVASESVQTIITSPPYYKKRNYSESNEELGAEKTDKMFVKRLANHLDSCRRVLKHKGSLFLNMGDTYDDLSLSLIPHRVVFKLLKKGWILKNTIIWKKNGYIPSPAKRSLTNSYEFIFHLVKSKDYFYEQLLIPTKETKFKANTIHQKGQNANYSIVKSPSFSGLTNKKNLNDFWTEDIVESATANQAIVKKYSNLNHPAPFPVDITILPILATSKPGDVVMDIFSGSGTVGEAALKLGRRYIGFELNPNFNDLQIARFEDAISYKEHQEKLDNAITLYNAASELSKAA